MAYVNVRHVLILIFVIVALSSAVRVGATGITATVTIGLCGDGLVGTNEQCDGSNLGGASCSSRGYSGGTLTCYSSCEFNTSACTSSSPAPVSSGGGGGGGGGSVSSAPTTSITFSGKAYPRTTVTLLKDAQVSATTIAASDATFSVNVSGISGGSYIFSVYSEDTKGVRSSLLTFPVSVTSGASTAIGNIFIAPTISVDKSEVRQGDVITVFGQSTPDSEITISVNSEEEFFVKEIADASGAYVLNFDTTVLELGQHSTKARVAADGEISSFSKVVNFTVGTKNVPIQTVSRIKGDISSDKRVNLIDFSILAYWFNRTLTPAALPRVDLNGDQRVNLIDFSIMAYHWTG